MERRINHKIVGMERIEAVDNKISIEESIVRIINSVVTTNIEEYSVFINLKEGIEISISSKEDMVANSLRS